MITSCDKKKLKENKFKKALPARWRKIKLLNHFSETKASSSDRETDANGVKTQHNRKMNKRHKPALINQNFRDNNR